MGAEREGGGNRIAVAYVTKWATTRGIVVVRDVMRSEMFPNHIRTHRCRVGPNHWTTDKSVAEERWRRAVETEAKRLSLAARKYAALGKGTPVYGEEESHDA